MSEFIVKEENFKLGLMERVPMPNEGNAFCYIRPEVVRGRVLSLTAGEDILRQK